MLFSLGFGEVHPEPHEPQCTMPLSTRVSVLATASRLQHQTSHPLFFPLDEDTQTVKGHRTPIHDAGLVERFAPASGRKKERERRALVS